jgi:hypothetical protein
MERIPGAVFFLSSPVVLVFLRLFFLIHPGPFPQAGRFSALGNKWGTNA